MRKIRTRVLKKNCIEFIQYLSSLYIVKFKYIYIQITKLSSFLNTVRLYIGILVMFKNMYKDKEKKKGKTIYL